MMKQTVARGSMIAAAALALTGLGAMATMMSRDTTPVIDLSEEVVIDTTAALAVMESQLLVTQGELDRAHRILDFSGRYRIPADMAARIYDHAVNEGIPPALGFQLVKIESGFTNSARSYASAIGLTQLVLLTARSYEPTLTREDLMNPDVSLRIGFRYLKDLLKRYDNDLELALEAYNKGPTLVSAQMDEGIQVKGRYSRAVLRGM
jgi:soluble lytic murein transglycosylase-like protein